MKNINNLKIIKSSQNSNMIKTKSKNNYEKNAEPSRNMNLKW